MPSWLNPTCCCCSAEVLEASLAHSSPTTSGVPHGIRTCAVYSAGTTKASAELVGTGVKAICGPLPCWDPASAADDPLGGEPANNANAAAAVPPVTTERRE